MGARWMQQKLHKMRKVRKAYLKPYRLHMTNRKPPNKDVIKEYKERAKSLGVDNASIDWFIQRYYADLNVYRGSPPGRKEAETRRQELKADRELEEQLSKVIVIIDNERRRLELFFSGTNKYAFFKETEKKLNRFRHSQDYVNEYSARNIYQMGFNHIHWYEWQLIE
jgi:hypothetical protein